MCGHLSFYFRDYRPIPALDVYDQEGLDEDDYSDISESQRAAAEREIRHREKEQGILYGRMRRGLMYGMLYTSLHLYNCVWNMDHP